MKGGKQVGVVCYICGREFGTRSIAIHEPQCIKKWDAQNQKMPKGKRQPRPTKPVEFDQSFSNDPKEREKQIAAINEASNAAATSNLAPCSNCGRKFTQARIETHEAVCTKLKMSPGKALKSGSGFYGQRVVVVDGEQVEVIKTKEKTFVDSPSNMQTNIISKVEEQISQNVKRGPLKMLPCPFCKRAFSHNAISIHTKNCKEKPAAASPPPPAQQQAPQAASPPPPAQQQAPQAATDKSIKCPFCNKGFPHNMITVHTKNCSSKPKQLSPQPPPPRQQQNGRPQGRQSIQNGTKVLQQGHDFSAPHVPHPPQAPRQANYQPEYEEDADWDSCNEEEPHPPTRANTQPNIQRNPQPSIPEPQRRISTGDRKKWDSPKVPQLPDAGYNRYSSSPRDRINSSLNADALGRGNEEVVDLVLGVNPNLVLTCMVCGLIVLKSQLNTHYHNYCDNSNMQRSATVPDKTQMRLSKSSSRSKIPQLSSRSSVTKLPDALPATKPSPPRTSPPSQQLSDSPEMLKCQSCNEEFGHDEIIEHEEECFKATVPASYTTNTFNRASSPSSNVVGKVVTGRFVTCINCGKAFTVRSLVIHQKTCLNQ